MSSAMTIGDWAIKMGLDPDLASFAKGESALSKIWQGMATLAVKAKEVATALLGFATEGANYADSIDEASQKTGINTTALQELAHAAGYSDMSLADLTTSLKFLSTNMVEADTKSKGARETFKALGVAFKDSDGKMRPANDVLLDLADKFKAMPDGARKATLATELFGKSGLQMIPMLNAGSAALKASGVEAHKLGKVYTALEIQQGVDMADSTKGLSDAWIGLKRTLGAVLMPMITKAANALTKWIVENRKAIASKLKDIIEALGEALKVLGGIFAWFADNTWALKAAMVALAVVFISTLGPVAALVAAIGLIIGVVMMLKGPIGQVVGWIGKQFSNLADEITAKFQAVLRLVERVREATGVNSLKKRIHEGLAGDIERNNAQLLAGNAVQTMRAKGFKKELGFQYSPEYRALHPELGPPLAPSLAVPRAPGTGTKNVTQTNSVVQNITAPPGTSPEQLGDFGKKINGQMTDFLGTQLREAGEGAE